MIKVRVVFEHGELAFFRGSHIHYPTGLADGSNPNGPRAARVAGERHCPEADALPNAELVELAVRDRCSKEPKRPGSATAVRGDGSETACPEAENCPGRPVAVIAPAPIPRNRRRFWPFGSRSDLPAFGLPVVYLRDVQVSTLTGGTVLVREWRMGKQGWHDWISGLRRWGGELHW